MVKRGWRVSPALARFSAPPPSRSMTQRTCSMCAPRSRKSLAERTTCPPEVTTSSMMTRVRPSTSPPSASLRVPYSLAFLRTKRVGRPVTCESMVAMGMPPISRPARASTCSGSSGAIARAISARSRGSDSKRYLSKYSLLMMPERSLNSPVMWATLKMRRARSVGISSPEVRDWLIGDWRLFCHELGKLARIVGGDWRLEIGDWGLFCRRWTQMNADRLKRKNLRLSASICGKNQSLISNLQSLISNPLLHQKRQQRFNLVFAEVEVGHFGVGAEVGGVAEPGAEEVGVRLVVGQVGTDGDEAGLGVDAVVPVASGTAFGQEEVVAGLDEVRSWCGGGAGWCLSAGEG